MGSWTTCGESMPTTVCAIQVIDRDLPRAQGNNTARERIHGVVWQKAIAEDLEVRLDQLQFEL